MASGQSSVLQEELTCPVCLDLYRDPHLLPCGHNFCKTCLSRLKRQADRGHFRCPECRDSHRCGVALQKNFKLANIADDFRLRRRQSASAAAVKPSEAFCPTMQLARAACANVPCDYCPAEASGGECASAEGATSLGQGSEVEKTFAVKTCLKCEVSMCQEHLKPHLELPAFREHPLTEPMNDFWRRKCPDHDEIFRYYCMVDKVYVCNVCTVEGGHSGHTIKTLKNTMKDLKVNLDKQMYRTERKYSLTEKKIQEQKEKERQNKKFMDDSDQSLARLGEDLKAKVLRFVGRLKQCSRMQCSINGPTIQKNISRITQDQVRLQEVRCGVESLQQENDPFRFIEAYRTTGKRCRRQLRKTLYYPDYVDLDKEALSIMMESEMRKFLNQELQCHITAAISSFCQLSDPEEEEEEGDDNEEEAEDEDDEDEDDFLDDFLDDSSEEEMRSEGEEEEEEGLDNSELGDDTWSPSLDDDEEEEEEEEEDDDDDDEDDDDEEDEEEDEEAVRAV